MTKTQVVYEGERLLVLERDHWQFVERKKGKAAAAIVALTDDGELILTEQYRVPLDARVIDWPAGLIGDDDGEDSPERAARRELEEETGYACKTLEKLAEGPTSAGITSETLFLFRATGVEKKGKGGGVGSEKIVVHTVPRNDVVAWLKRKAAEGIAIDIKVWSGLYFVRES